MLRVAVHTPAVFPSAQDRTMHVHSCRTGLKVSKLLLLLLI